jgi:hypothetical protein
MIVSTVVFWAAVIAGGIALFRYGRCPPWLPVIRVRLDQRVDAYRCRDRRIAALIPYAHKTQQLLLSPGDSQFRGVVPR